MGGRVGVGSTYVRVELDPTLPYPNYTTYIYIYIYIYIPFKKGVIPLKGI